MPRERPRQNTGDPVVPTPGLPRSLERIADLGPRTLALCGLWLRSAKQVEYEGREPREQEENPYDEAHGVEDSWERDQEIDIVVACDDETEGPGGDCEIASPVTPT